MTCIGHDEKGKRSMVQGSKREVADKEFDPVKYAVKILT